MLNKNSILQHGFKITSRSDDFYSAYERVSYHCNLDILDASFAAMSYMAITDPNLLKHKATQKSTTVLTVMARNQGTDTSLCFQTQGKVALLAHHEEAVCPRQVKFI